MIYSCVIITDDDEEAKFLKNYIAHHEELELLDRFNNIYQMPSNIYGHIIFINVDASVLTGTDQIKLMKSNFEFLVFTGAADEYARIAYDLEGLDYLPKPIAPGRFEQTFQKIKGLVSIEQKTKITLDSLFAVKDAKSNYAWVFNTYREIIAVESARNYVKIHTSNGTYLAHLSLTKFEFHVLALPNFIRVYRSFIISRKHIQKITGHNILMKGLTIKIPISKNYIKNLQEFIDGISVK